MWVRAGDESFVSTSIPLQGLCRIPGSQREREARNVTRAGPSVSS